MSLENYTLLKEQLYSKAALDFSNPTINAVNFNTEYYQEELAMDSAGACKGTAGTFGTAGSVCGCAGTFGSLGSYGCGDSTT